jgi:hypothetical protein
MWSVHQISFNDVEPWLLKKHYAKRIPPIEYAFGAFDEKSLIGIVTYGTPVSSNLRNGICGEKYSENVLELNRLCCDTIKNLASFLVAQSFRLIPSPRVIVSFADTKQGHIGYIYQATNFIYTGLSAKRSDWKIKGQEHLHGATIADKFRGVENRSQALRNKYGNDFYSEDRPRKHRYIYFIGSKKQKQQMKSCLKYTIQPYPKGETKRYNASAVVDTQMLLIS